MNGNNKTIRITIIGGLAVLLLALVVVLMANPAAASGSGDWPPPATGDWVINQPTTVIDEGWVYLSDQNITINSKLTVYNSYIYLDDYTSGAVTFHITVSVGGTLVANETEFDSGNTINLQVDGDAYTNDCEFWYTENFNISARGAAYINDTTFEYIFNDLNVVGSLDFSYSSIYYTANDINVGGTMYMLYSYLYDTYNDITIDGTMTMNRSSIYDTYNDFNVDGTMYMLYSYIYDTYNDFNIVGSLTMNSSRIYDTGFDINVDGTLTMTYYSYIYWTYNDFNIDGTVTMVISYIWYTYNDINIDGTLDMDNSGIDDVYNNMTVSGDLDMFQARLTDVYGTLVISGTSTMDDTYIDDIDRGFWISGDVDFNDTDIRYVNYAFNVTGYANLQDVRFYRIYDGMNLIGAVDMSFCDLSYIYYANFTGTVDIGDTRWYYMYYGVQLTGEIDIDTCEMYYVRNGLYIGSDDVSIINSNFYSMTYDGIYIDHCDPYFENVTLRTYSTMDVYFSTDMTWSYENRFMMAVGNGIWVDGGVPTFIDVSVEADNRVDFNVEYTGNEEEPTIYLMGMACPVLIDSPDMDVVSGLTVHDSSFNMASYTTATNPGMNPLYIYVDFMVMSAGIGVINYDDTTITDVVSHDNYYSSIYGPYIYGYYYGYSGWNNYGPSVQVGAAIYGDFSTSPNPMLTVSDMTVDDGTGWFGHMYYPGYSGTGVPQMDDTVLITNVTVNSNDAAIFGFDIMPSFEGKRTMNINIRITDCTFNGMSDEIMYYNARAGPGINPSVNMVDVTESIDIDNNMITMGEYDWTYFNIEGVWDDHMSDTWDRTVTFSANDFVDSGGSLFYVEGLSMFSRGSCTLNVLNNNFDNVTDIDNGNGPYYAEYFDTIRFVGNQMTDMHYAESADFYDEGGDSNGINPVDWLFKDNTIVNCTNERWDEIIFLEFGGDVVVQGNDISMGNGFLSMYHVTEYTGTASLTIIENEYHDMASYIAEFGNVDEGNLYFDVTLRDNHIYNCGDFIFDYYGNSQTITNFDRDATFTIEDNTVQNNTGGFLHIWGDVTVQNNNFWDNEGPILEIDYINLNMPTVVNNNLNGNVNLYKFVAKDRGYQLVPMQISNMDLPCTGTALSFTNMEVTLDHVGIPGASQAIWAMNSVINIYSSTIDGTTCTVAGDGSITTWWPLEAKVTWADANGVDSETPVADALMVFYDANDDYYTSTYADASGMLAQDLYKEWMVDIDGILNYSPYSMKASSSGTTQEVTVILTSDLIGPDMIEMLLWDIFEPVVAITEPYDGAIFNKNSVEVFGFVAEVGSGLGPIEYSIDGGTWMTLTISPNGDWNVPLADLADGDRTLAVRARDIASNLATTSVTITIDTVPPDLTIGNTPPTTNNPNLIITGTIEVGAELFVNGMSHGIAESSSLMIELVLHEGANIILIEAMDAAKNTVFQTAEVLLDTQPPVLVITGPAMYMTTNLDTVTVMGIVDGHMSLTVDGTPVIADEDGSFSHVVILGSGENGIEVKATDEATNVAIATLTIELDQDPPYVEITDPADGYKTSDGVVEITILADLDSMLWINGRPTANDDGNTIRTILLLEGSNTITVTGRDPAGNEATDSIHVILDTMPPVLVVTTPAASEVWANSLTLNIEGFAYNATGVTINGEAADSFNTQTWAFSHSASLTNGENNITIEAEDEVNVVSQGLKAWISTSDPKLIVNTVDSLVTTPSVTISGETEAGIPIVLVEFGGGLLREFPVRYDGHYEFTLNLDDGGYDIKVSVEDEFGNTNSQQTGNFNVKQGDYITGGGEEDDTFKIEPIHIGLILAVIGITLIVAAFLAVYKISRREE